MRRYGNQATVAILMLMMLVTMRGVRGNIVDWILEQLIFLPGIIIGLSFHEFAHARVAVSLGDNTPKIQGRLTVNPAAHIEPFGFLTIFLAGFGWGKAVEINPYNFKNRRRDEFLVSIAGVIMNLIIALSFSVILKVFSGAVGYDLYLNDGYMLIARILYATVYINVVLMVFNLLPIPPLDGFSIITELFDLRKYPWYWNIYNNGFMILMVLVLTGATGRVMTPFINFLMGIMYNVGGF